MAGRLSRRVWGIPKYVLASGILGPGRKRDAGESQGGGDYFPPPPPPQSHEDVANVVVALTDATMEISWETARRGSTVLALGTLPDLAGATLMIGRDNTRYHRIQVATLPPGQADYYWRPYTVLPDTQETLTADIRKTTTMPTEPINLRAGHPRVWFTSDEQAEIEGRLVGSHSAAWNDVKTWVAARSANEAQDASWFFNESNGDYHAAAFAFAARFDGNSTWRAQVIAAALYVAGLNPGNVESGTFTKRRRGVRILTAVYDWLYDHLTSTQKTTLSNALYTWALELELPDGEAQDKGYVWNYRQENLGIRIMGLIASDHESAPSALETAVRIHDRHVMPTWIHYGQPQGDSAGGSMRGHWYMAFSMRGHLEGILALRSATNGAWDAFRKYPNYWKDLAGYFWCLYRSQDKRFMRDGDTAFPNLTPSKLERDWVHRRLFETIAKYTRDGRAQVMADAMFDVLGVWGTWRWTDILWYDPTVPKESVYPAVTWFSPDTGSVIDRSQSGPEEYIFRMTCRREMTRGHTHLDDLGITYYYKGLQLPDTGVYDSYGSTHWYNYYARTLSKNSILLHLANETYKWYSTTILRDGGQRWLDEATDVESTGGTRNLLDIVDPARGYTRSDWRAFDSSATAYLFAWADATAAYRATKVSLVTRAVVLVRSPSGASHPTIFVGDHTVTHKVTSRYILWHVPSGVTPTTISTYAQAWQWSLGGARFVLKRIYDEAGGYGEIRGGAGAEFITIKGETQQKPQVTVVPENEAGTYRVQWRRDTMATLSFVALTGFYAAPADEPLRSDFDYYKGGGQAPWWNVRGSDFLWCHTTTEENTSLETRLSARRFLFTGLTPYARYLYTPTEPARSAVTLTAGREGTIYYEPGEDISLATFVKI